MKKYRDKAEDRRGDKVHPDMVARTALIDAKFSTQTKNDFFDAAYSDIMFEYFQAWISTEPHEVKTCEFLYSCVLGLGDVKRKLIEIETYGKNVPYMENDSNG